MPPKRGKGSLKSATPKARAAKRSTQTSDATTEDEETFDVDSIVQPHGGSTATPKSTVRNSHGASKRKKVRTEAREDEAAGSLLDVVHPGAGVLSNDNDDDVESLAATTLQALLGGAAITTTVDNILNVYRSGDQRGAMCAILNVLVKASGVTAVELDHNALAEGMDTGPLLEELYARVAEDSADYLLVNKEARYKRFRRAFPEFFERLVHLAYSADILLDATLLPVLTRWAVAMCESKARSFRHTACAALLGLLQGLNRLAADLRGRLGLVTTKKETSATQHTLGEVVEWRDHIFSQAVHQRLRDVAPEIRLGCFQKLKDWVLLFPEEFMANKYLRYFGMPLHDKRPELRVEALDMVLQTLARVADAYNQMHLFLQYIAPRVVEMSSDVDVRCAELAIRVAAMMVRGDSEAGAEEGSELLSSEMVDRVLLTLFDERPTIREAAGILLKVFVHSRTVGEEREAEQIKIATELLCLFARTLRESYLEEMPEKYLVDALWSPERPPLVLTEYAPILAASQSSSPIDCVVGLGFVAALLGKISGSLTFGPLPKDDRRHNAKKPSAAALSTITELRQSLSEDAGRALCTALEKHRGNPAVIRAVCSVIVVMDLGVFSPQRHTVVLSTLSELQKATFTATLSAGDARAVMMAWHCLAFGDHPHKTAAEGHVVAMLERVVRQSEHTLTRTTAQTEEALQVWRRLHVLSSLAPMGAQEELIRSTLQRLCSAQGGPFTSASAELTGLVLGTAFNHVLWHVKAATEAAEGGSSGSATGAEVVAREHVSAFITDLLSALESASGPTACGSGAGAVGDGAMEGHEGVTAFFPDSLRARCDAFVYLCDVSALRHHDLSQLEQGSLLNHFQLICEELFPRLSTSQEAHKTLLRMSGGALTSTTAAADPSLLARVAASRRTQSALEGASMRVVSGAARLFLFQRLHPTLAPSMLIWWTQCPSKPVSDAFKGLFHALRDRAGDSFGLERDVLLESYSQCARLGATPASADALYQIGSKLAAMHFLSTDRYYPACVAVVQFAVQYAASTDPLLLQGALPYCGKLRQADALRLLHSDLSSQGIFTSATASPYVRAFVSAMRRAAKLDDVVTASAQTSNSTSNNGKRARTITTSSMGADDDELLAAIAQSAPQPGQEVSRRSSRGGTNARLSMATRVVTEDGWHVPTTHGEGADVEVLSTTPISVGSTSTPRQATVHGGGAAGVKRSGGGRSVVNVPSTQETAQSSIAGELDSEVFIATQEYE